MAQYRYTTLSASPREFSTIRMIPATFHTRSTKLALSCRAGPDDNQTPTCKNIKEAIKKSLTQLKTQTGQSVNGFFKLVTPTQEGDAMDLALMVVSVCVFTYMAAHLYIAYAWWYHSAGLQPLFYYWH